MSGDGRQSNLFIRFGDENVAAQQTGNAVDRFPPSRWRRHFRWRHCRMRPPSVRHFDQRTGIARLRPAHPILRSTIRNPRWRRWQRWKQFRAIPSRIRSLRSRSVPKKKYSLTFFFLFFEFLKKICDFQHFQVFQVFQDFFQFFQKFVYFQKFKFNIFKFFFLFLNFL